QNISPSLRKYEDSKKMQANDEGGRPFPVAKLSELYLLAAEAAFQTGKVNQAVTLINVIRERAAYRPGLSASDLS
ncbi:RagB/SusD family nutrient uptake outer membrane protein, partial [Streptomyces sp. UMAF16]|nr:RagB/SusD family nutrient uptake outer membrane protein [Streptomyces sp. UMAF16]